MINRERIGSLYTYAQSLLRAYTLALGRKMTEMGRLDEPEDIFYLYWDEVTKCLKRPSDDDELSELVDSRRAEVESSRELELPEVIYGDVAPPIEVREHKSQLLSGTPTSPGRYRGPACVVHGIRDFEKVQPGDVLVVPFTDVGWTPLFLKAGAVVAESGGLLSHSSIIAREYEIPAVVSVNDACRVIPDGAHVSVDGYRGRVSLKADASEDGQIEHLKHSQKSYQGE